MVHILGGLGNRHIAFVTGKAVGKHKFTRISPNKTIEGCIGGTIGAIVMVLVYTLICNKVWNLQINYIYILLIGMALSVRTNRRFSSFFN